MFDKLKQIKFYAVYPKVIDGRKERRVGREEERKEAS